MILPSKIVQLQDSVLGKTPAIMERLNGPVHLRALYSKLSNQFGDWGEFLIAIDILYVIGAIDVDVEGVVTKC